MEEAPRIIEYCLICGKEAGERACSVTVVQEGHPDWSLPAPVDSGACLIDLAESLSDLHSAHPSLVRMVRTLTEFMYAPSPLLRSLVSVSGKPGTGIGERRGMRIILTYFGYIIETAHLSMEVVQE